MTTVPTVYIISGPNGAGKTTFAIKFLPGFVQCTEFLNADLIASGLSPFAPETQSVLASKLMLERFRGIVEKRATFALETTLAARSYCRKIPLWQAKGYRIVLIYLWLPSADLAVARVANRIRQGGHSIPVPIIRRRFQRGLSNFYRSYRTIADEWLCFDASQLPPQRVAEDSGEKTSVHNVGDWQQTQVQRNLEIENRHGNKETLTDKAVAAFREAAQSVVEQARYTHTPIVIYRNGLIEKISAEAFSPGFTENEH